VSHPQDDVSPSAATQYRHAMGVDHSWLNHLSRVGWAWEFLRRNQDYRRDYAHQDDGRDAALWGLKSFEDPSLDARHAAVFWRSDWCPAVLPVTARPLLPGETSSLTEEKLACLTKVLPHHDGNGADVLFNTDGRLLQLELTGSASFAEVALSAVVIPMPEPASARVLAIRRFTHLVASGSLRPMLYPPERRAPRLTKVLIALDCWQEQQSYRDIAVRLHGQRRVDEQWNDPRDHLRDQIRRAVYYGRNLMTGGYRQFLH